MNKCKTYNFFTILNLSYLRLYIWFSYLILFPIQILPQGNFQIADYILLFGVAIMVVRFLTNKGKLSFNNIYLKGAFYFTIYSLIVSMFYFAISLDYKYIIPSFNYIYCFIFCNLLWFNSYINTFPLF